MTIFKKQYYLVFAKPITKGAIVNRTNGYAVTCVYRKRDKNGKKKFFIDHRLRSNHLLTWWQAKWWMFLIKIYGRNSRTLFAYKFPQGEVFIKKAVV
jgi:hypothetical protein